MTFPHVPLPGGFTLKAVVVDASRAKHSFGGEEDFFAELSLTELDLDPQKPLFQQTLFLPRLKGGPYTPRVEREIDVARHPGGRGIWDLGLTHDSSLKEPGILPTPLI